MRLLESRAPVKRKSELSKSSFFSFKLFGLRSFEELHIKPLSKLCKSAGRRDQWAHLYYRKSVTLGQLIAFGGPHKLWPKRALWEAVLLQLLIFNCSNMLLFFNFKPLQKKGTFCKQRDSRPIWLVLTNLRAFAFEERDFLFEKQHDSRMIALSLWNRVRVTGVEMRNDLIRFSDASDSQVVSHYQRDWKWIWKL